MMILFAGPNGKDINVPEEYVEEFLKVKDTLLQIIKTSDKEYAKRCWDKTCKLVQIVEDELNVPRKDPIQIACSIKEVIPNLFEALVRHGIIPKDKLN